MIMASTLSGIAAYGFDLGGAEDDWHLKDVDRWDRWEPSWLTPEQLDVDSTLEYEGLIVDRLVDAGLELLIVTYGMTSNDYTSYILAAWTTESTGSKTSPLHLEDLLARREIERWDEALLKALKVLDIRPWQPHPMWLLTQSYG